MLSESSLCDIYNIPVVSPCGNKVEGDEFTFSFDLDKPGLGFDDIFPDYIQADLDTSVSENFFSGLVHDKTVPNTCNDNFEIFNDILTDNDLNFNFLLSSDLDMDDNIKKEPSLDDFENLPEPLESLPDEGWFSNTSNEHPSSSSLESIPIGNPLEAAIKDEDIDCVLNNVAFLSDNDADISPPQPVERPRIVSTWKVKSVNKRPPPVSASLRTSEVGNFNEVRPFGSNTAPCYTDYSANRSVNKQRTNKTQRAANRPFKPKTTAFSSDTNNASNCPQTMNTPIHRHGQTERERRAQENKRMRNIEKAIRSITAFKSDAYFPRDRATKERTLKATKALIHFYHTSSIEFQNANLRAEIDEMKYRLSTARRLKQQQQQSTPFSGVNCNATIVSASSTITSRLSTVTSSNKFVPRQPMSTLTKPPVY